MCMHACFHSYVCTERPRFKLSPGDANSRVQRVHYLDFSGRSVREKLSFLHRNRLLDKPLCARRDKAYEGLKQRRCVVSLQKTVEGSHRVITHSLSSGSLGQGELCGRVCILLQDSRFCSHSPVCGCHYAGTQRGSAICVVKEIV